MASKRRRLRRQRVTLRFKRREHIKGSVRRFLVKGTVAVGVLGVGAMLVLSGDSILWSFLKQHTPQVTFKTNQVLSGVTIGADLPKNCVLLWLPGAERWLANRVCQRYPAVRTIRFDRHLADNRIDIKLEPRVPLATWNGMGIDEEGRTFMITPGTWKALPQVLFQPAQKRVDAGRWLKQLSAMRGVWEQVNSIKQDAFGTVQLVLKTGTTVVWGPVDLVSPKPKADILARILDDAHKNLGGITHADLRFFEQGRIIVRPKTNLK